MIEGMDSRKSCRHYGTDYLNSEAPDKAHKIRRFKSPDFCINLSQLFLSFILSNFRLIWRFGHPVKRHFKKHWQFLNHEHCLF